MKVAILKCDNVLEKFQAEFGSYTGMIEDMFKRVDSSLEFTTFDCLLGEYPDNINDFDFYITTGSKADAYADLDWIHQLIAFVKKLDENKKKLIGICFGHQIVALALGGKISKSSKGWGVGIANNKVLEQPSWMHQKKPQLDILASHQDQVDEITPTSKVIANSNFCPNFLVQWNDHFLSIQGHPEWNKNYSRTLMNDRVAIIPAATIKAGRDSLSQDPDNELFTRWMLDFVRP